MAIIIQFSWAMLQVKSKYIGMNTICALVDDSTLSTSKFSMLVVSVHSELEITVGHWSWHLVLLWADNLTLDINNQTINFCFKNKRLTNFQSLFQAL